MLETSRGKKRGSDGNDSPQALNFHGCDDSAHLLSTYCVQALFILKTHSPLARPTLRLEKVEFREAKPLGQSPAQLSKGTGTGSRASCLWNRCLSSSSQLYVPEHHRRPWARGQGACAAWPSPLTCVRAPSPPHLAL